MVSPVNSPPDSVFLGDVDLALGILNQFFKISSAVSLRSVKPSTFGKEIQEKIEKNEEDQIEQ